MLEKEVLKILKEKTKIEKSGSGSDLILKFNPIKKDIFAKALIKNANGLCIYIDDTPLYEIKEPCYFIGKIEINYGDIKSIVKSQKLNGLWVANSTNMQNLYLGYKNLDEFKKTFSDALNKLFGKEKIDFFL